MSKRAPKCRNFQGKKCFTFNGKNYYYADTKAGRTKLANKLGLPLIQLDNQIKNNNNHNTTKIFIDEQNRTMKIDTREKMPYGLLSRKFGIKRVGAKKLLSKQYTFSRSKVSVVDKLGPYAEIKCKIRLEFYISFPSYHIERSCVTKNGEEDGEISMRKLKQAETEGKVDYRKRVYEYNGLVKDITDQANIFYDQYYREMSNIAGVTILHSEWNIISQYNKKKMHFENGFIRSKIDECLELSEWVNIEYNDTNRSGDSCAVRLISKRFPDLYWDIKKLETLHGVQVCDFFSFCETNNIDVVAYGINEKIKRRIVNKHDCIGKIVCIIYNNHIFPVTGGKLKRFVSKKLNIKHVDDSEEKLIYLLEDKKVLPSKILIETLSSSRQLEKINDIHITSCIVRDKKYLCNSEYEICLTFLKKIGKEDYIKDNISVNKIPKLLEKIYKVDDASSFIPEKDYFKTSPLLYKTGKEIRVKNVVGIDKNKCYTSCLSDLPFLIKFDYRSDPINIISVEDSDNYEIIDKNLYLVIPEVWTTLLPNTKLYAGYHLKYCRSQGVNFTLKEELVTNILPNYYRKFIKLTRKYIAESYFKSMWNVYIGNCEGSMRKSYRYKYSGIFTDESLETQNGFVKKIGDYNLLFKSFEQIINVRDKLPLAIQVKDLARRKIYDKIKELQIRDENIVQISTDAIYYYGNLPSNLDKNDFNGWKKVDEFRELPDFGEPLDDSALTVCGLITPSEGKNRKLHIKYAGSGKTTYIVNKLVPKIIKKGIDYIVLTPTHTTLSEYRNLGINCQIMQKYVFDGTIPNEQYIIVDEIGFVDRACHDLLYKLVHYKKDLECFGDFNQLLAVGESKPLNQRHYLNYMFTHIDETFINYRNNFTKKYYDRLIESNDNKYLAGEVKKWSSNKLSYGRPVLCYRHKTKEAYNNKMLKYLGYDDWKSEGVSITCKNNRLYELGIYNRKMFTIWRIYQDDDSENIYHLLDTDGNIFKIPEKKLVSNFEMAYAINIHQAQGATLKSYYWASEDDFFINGRIAYTIISRLHQKKK